MASVGCKVISRRFLFRRLSSFTSVCRRSICDQFLNLGWSPSWHRSESVLSSRVSFFHRESVRSKDEKERSASDHIIPSPYPDISIPDGVSLSHLMLNEFPKYKNTIALVDGLTGQEMTYSQLHTSVMKATSALVKLGLRKGDVVTLFSPNCPQFAIAALAIAAAGGTFSCVNHLYTAAELKNAMSHVGARFLVTIPALVPVAMEAKEQCPTVKEIIVFGEAEKCRPFSSLLEDDVTAFPENLDFRPHDDIVSLPFSSGTTSLPKAVMLSHYNLVANIIQNREEVAQGYKANRDCLLAVLPFYHIYGQVVIMLCALFCGAKVVTLPNFQPTTYLETIQKYQPTYLHIVPPLLLFLAKNPSVVNYEVSSVRQVITGGAPVSPSLVYEFLDRFNQKAVFRQGFGLTETSPTTHISNKKSTKYHTVGPAINNTKFKIVDLETRKPLGPGESGELCIQGPQVMVGYYANKKATDETIVDGWLHSGDLGHYDEDGHLIIDDRIKELIKVKGYQVAPAELESLLVGHPSVADAAVVGIKSEKLGEAPKAFVVLKPEAKVSAEELNKYVADRVASFKQLSGGIEFRSEIPKTASGKILRKNLIDEANKN